MGRYDATAMAAESPHAASHAVANLPGHLHWMTHYWCPAFYTCAGLSRWVLDPGAVAGEVSVKGTATQWESMAPTTLSPVSHP